MQTYYAKSIFVSKTFWVNAAAILLALLEARDILNVLPPGAMVYVPSVLAALNIILRVTNIRPVAFTAPGTITPVQVPSLLTEKQINTAAAGGGYPQGKGDTR